MSEQYYVHLKRLENDYRSMQRLHGSVITWEPLDAATPPRSYPSKYRVMFHLLAPTVEGNRPQHVVEIDCSRQDYPRFPPVVTFQTPIVKHPHVFSDGSHRVCLGGFPLEESLAELCVRLARFLQFDANLINPKSLASVEFYAWYQQNRAHLPLDRSPLPDLDGMGTGFRVKSRRPGGT
jgi:ubiquitin-protein ligase